MATAIKTRITRIGNSRGIRIPKVWLEQTGLPEEVLVVMESNRLVISPAHAPRHGWEEQFRDMAESQDDRLLDAPVPTRWDTEEWEW